MKYVFLIADGMGDWANAAFGGKTALEAAYTPGIDKIAQLGIMGTCRTVPKGMSPGSDVANMALLGFDPIKYHTGRGPIEAAAQGLKLCPDDLVWRCNLVSLSEFDVDGIMRDYSAGHITNSDGAALMNMLQENLGDETVSFYPGVQYRNLLVQKGGASGNCAKLHIRPPHDILEQKIGIDLAEMKKEDGFFTLIQNAARLLSASENKTAANAVWPWGQGRPLLLPDFLQTFGLRGAVVSAVDLVRGLGRASGMEVLEVDGVTGLIDTNYAGKVQAALNFLQNGDFVYLHVEAPDECGHMGDPVLKKRAIELFDERIVIPIFQALGEQAIIVVTCDHFTPLQVRTHTSDPVPFTLCGRGIESDSAQVFSEQNARQSGLALSCGYELLPFVLKCGKG